MRAIRRRTLARRSALLRISSSARNTRAASRAPRKRRRLRAHRADACCASSRSFRPSRPLRTPATRTTRCRSSHRVPCSVGGTWRGPSRGTCGSRDARAPVPRDALGFRRATRECARRLPRAERRASRPLAFLHVAAHDRRRSGFEIFRAELDAKRNAAHLPIGELVPRPQIALVEFHAQPRRAQASRRDRAPRARRPRYPRARSERSPLRWAPSSAEYAARDRRRAP